jgi:hypothetical protein
VNGPLSVATIVAALALGVWCLARAGLNRAPSRFDLLATAVLGLLVAVLVVVAVVGLFDGSRPSETSTFIGYLITGVACLVIPVLVLRLQQIASVTGG